ncbi:MAG: response regulator [Erythrobacter sp.]|jgi:two-component SAPR family response regulator|nr:response regulator [Erythrobacter sp.]
MTSQALTGRNILLVEDEYLQARETTAILQRAGATVIGPVANVADAFALIETQTPPLAVVDINLGTGPCFEIVERLESAGVPFVLLTGYDQFSIPEKYAGIPLAEKPVNEALLVEMIQRLCD